MQALEAIQRIEGLAVSLDLSRGEILKKIKVNASTFYRWKIKTTTKIKDAIAKKILRLESSQATAKDTLEKPQQSESVETAQSTPTASDSSHFQDEKGRYFNAAIHLAEDDGAPVLKDGKLVIKPRQKQVDREDALREENETRMQEEKEREENARIEQEQAQKTRATAENLQKKNEYFAHIASSLFINTGCAFFGEKFKPVDKAEYDELHFNFETYLATVPDFDIPPAWALGIGLAGYSIKHMKGQPEPNTLWSRVKGWFSRTKAKMGVQKDVEKAQEAIQ